MAPNGYIDWHNLTAMLTRGGVLFPPTSASLEGETLMPVRIHRYPVQDSTEVRENIFQQIHIWFSLKHENVLPLLGAITENFATSMVIPFMERGSAFDYVQDRVVDPRPLLKGIANGLSYLHSRSSVHGAIKGTNIFISGNGFPYITVFNCSCGLYSFGGTLACSCQRTTRWLAPEQIDDRKATTKSDVWAFGMTAIELFTRHPPFKDIQEAQGVLIEILQRPLNRPSNEATCYRMTDAWWKICSECIKMEALSRPQVSHVADKIGEMVQEK